MLYEINGPFFFGAAHKLVDVTGKVGMNTRLVIIKMREVPTIDTTGLHHLRTLLKPCRRHGVILYRTEVRPVLLAVLEKSGLADELGNACICKDIQTALRHFQASTANHL